MIVFKDRFKPDPRYYHLSVGDKWMRHDNTLHVFDGNKWVMVQGLTDGVTVTEGSLSYVEYPSRPAVEPLDMGDPLPDDANEGRVLYLGGPRAGEVVNLSSSEELVEVVQFLDKSAESHRYILATSEFDTGPYWVYRYDPVDMLEPPPEIPF